MTTAETSPCRLMGFIPNPTTVNMKYNQADYKIIMWYLTKRMLYYSNKKSQQGNTSHQPEAHCYLWYRTTWARKPQVGLIVFKLYINYNISPRDKWGISSETFLWGPTNENFGVESSPKRGYKVIYSFGPRIQLSNRSKKLFIKFERNQ